MKTYLPMALAVAMFVAPAEAKAAQSDEEACAAIERMAAVGDKLTITTIGGHRISGRLTGLHRDALIMRGRLGEHRYPYKDIFSIRVTRGGFLLRVKRTIFERKSSPDSVVTLRSL